MFLNKINTNLLHLSTCFFFNNFAMPLCILLDQEKKNGCFVLSTNVG